LELDGITFDYWQTLILDTPEGLQKAREVRIEGIQEVLGAHGIRRSLEEINRAYDESGQRIMRIWAKDEDISPGEQILIFLDSLDLNHSGSLKESVLEEVESAYSTPLLHVLPSLSSGAKEVLQRVKDSGCKIGLISNTGRTPGYILRMVLERLGILHFFDALTFSDESRVRKPNPQIFLHHLQELEVTPTMALHIGDDLRCDVGGAKGVGMRAIHLDRGEEKRSDVQPDGIIEDLTQLHEILERLERFG
jgi:putative hydrolase of the HAD superfamily